MITKVLFITGTDTGVGKTLLTSLLLCHLRRRGARALALKPFCSGSRADARLLHDLQNGDLTLDEINPFYFPEPVAPLVSARKHRRRIPLDKVVEHINSIASRLGPLPSHPNCLIQTKNRKTKSRNYILIEGSGGLLVPLGEDYTVRDLIARLNCDVLVVSRNQLGTINHTLLTLRALDFTHSAFRTPHSTQPLAFSLSHVLLMRPATPDLSTATNPSLLAELLAPIPVLEFPFLGRHCMSVPALRKAAARFHKPLARLVA